MPVSPVHTPPNSLQEIGLSGGSHIVWASADAGQLLHLPTLNTHSVVMHFTLAGTTTVHVQALNRSFDIRANQHNMIYPAGQHVGLDIVTTQPCQFLQIHIAPEFFKVVSDENGPTFQHLARLIQRKQPLCLAPANLLILPPMQTALAHIIRCPLACSLKRLFLEAKVQELLILQLGQFEATTTKTTLSGPDYEKVMEARRLLETHFDRPPTLPELSRQVGLNEFKLKKLFKEIVGNTIHGWVLNYRLSRAYELLQEPDLSISEIAYQVGYQHPAHFTTAFKKKFGMVPSQLLTPKF